MITSAFSSSFLSISDVLHKYLTVKEQSDKVKCLAREVFIPYICGHVQKGYAAMCKAFLRAMSECMR